MYSDSGICKGIKTEEQYKNEGFEVLKSQKMKQLPIFGQLFHRFIQVKLRNFCNQYSITSFGRLVASALSLDAKRATL
jgi:hypothetical protein